MHKTRLAVSLLTLAGLFVYAWGVRHDLPYVFLSDERGYWVERSVHMASSGDMNPGWFGHPSSTVVYPLVLLCRIWYYLAMGKVLPGFVSDLQVAYASNPTPFFLMGRYLCVAYTVLSIPLTYQLGKRIFGVEQGLIAAWFFMLCPLMLTQTQTVSSDSATVFYTMLALWSLLRLYEVPNAGNQVLAGLTIGLAMSTKYNLGALCLVMLMVDVFILHRQRATIASGVRFLPGFIAILIGFAVTTPYFFLDWGSVLRDIKIVMGSSHLGADGLSPLGNGAWYLTNAIPNALGWPRAVLAYGGLCLAVRKHIPPQGIAIVFLGAFLLVISLSPLHWQRWIVPLLPILGMLVAHALVVGISETTKRLRRSSALGDLVVALLVLALSTKPAYDVLLMDIRQSRPSTFVLAREWIVQNLPKGSSIVKEPYTAPLENTDFQTLIVPSVADRSFVSYLDDGYQYLAVSSAVYDRFLAEPERYGRQVDFYQGLANYQELVASLRPSLTTGGPTVLIYKLGPMPTALP